MSIEFFRKRAYQKGIIDHASMTPEKKYEKMVNAVGEIKETEGFKEIVGYWQRDLEMHAQELSASDPLKSPQYIAVVLDRYNRSKSFLSFLENLLEAHE